MRQARQRGYEVLGEYKPEDILPHTGKDAPERVYDGHRVKMTSLRYQTFSESLRCVCCGIKGSIMLLELPPKGHRPHFNLYAEREGELVQMTKDHKQPKSKGGKDYVGNMQTMCATCNELKGNRQGGNKKVLSYLRKIRDGAQVIYMVSASEYWDDMLDGFATSPKGIARIIERHIEYCPLFEDGYKIEVDMQELRAIVVGEDEFLTTYYIHKVERI